MTIHDQARVAGVSESCRYNDHSDCRAPGCGCTCHTPVHLPNLEPKVIEGPENACPLCGAKRPANESYCRVDGTKLTSLACGMCGRGMNPEDKFCFNCGAPKGTVGKVRVPQVVTVPPVEVDMEATEQAVLRGLQEELSHVDTGNAAKPEELVQRTVVESPGGAQGTFKLVSKPNPNKIRGPVSAAPASGTPNRSSPVAGRSVKLPIKPA